MNKKIIFFILLNYILSADYYNEVQPIFDANCIDCHTGNFPSGGLNLTDYENLMEGGNSGAVIIPEDYESSLLWQRLDSGEMPVGGDPLSQSDIDLIANWITQGANICDEGFSYYPDAADEYNNITVQDGGTCFNDGDLEALSDMVFENDFDASMESFEPTFKTTNSPGLHNTRGALANIADIQSSTWK